MSSPSDGSDRALPPLAVGSFPVVVFGHGRLGTGPNNHLEIAYIMDHLASWGIVATSVSLDFVGQFRFSAAMDQDIALPLRDADGAAASLPLSNYGRIPFPITHNDTLFQNFPKKSVLRTTRLPLADFDDLEFSK